MARARLNQFLLRKMAKKLRRDEALVRQGISHRASQLGVGSEAAQLLWANRIGIAIGGSLGKVPPDVRQEVREHLSPAAAKPAPRAGRGASVPRVQKKGDGVRSSVNLLLRHPDLKARCANTLKGSPPFDPAVNQAMLVLENYLRGVAGGVKSSAPDLAAIVFKAEDPLIRMSTDKDVQNGYMHLTRGLFAVLRNPTHHGSGMAQMSREEAISYCAFINAFLDDIAIGERKAKPAPPAKPRERTASDDWIDDVFGIKRPEEPAAPKSEESTAARPPTATSKP